MNTLETLYKKLEKEDLLGYDYVLHYLTQEKPELEYLHKNADILDFEFSNKELKIDNQKEIDLLNESADEMIKTVKKFKAFIKKIENIFEMENYSLKWISFGIFPQHNEILECFQLEFKDFIFTFDKDFDDFEFHLKDDFFYDFKSFPFIDGLKLNSHLEFCNNQKALIQDLLEKIDFLKEFNPQEILEKIKKIRKKPLLDMVNNYYNLIEKLVENIY